MKNLKERTFARQVMRTKLGFAPALENIVPLESSVYFGEVNYVLFGVKGNDEVLYRASRDDYGISLEIEREGHSLSL